MRIRMYRFQARHLWSVKIMVNVGIIASGPGLHTDTRTFCTHWFTKMIMLLLLPHADFYAEATDDR